MGIDFRHPLPRVECVPSRQRLILDYCRDKTVLHLGCVESGRLQDSYDSGSLLHSQLVEAAKRVIGVDNDFDGIQFLRNRGIENLFCADIERLDWRDIIDSIEVVVAGEIIEHLSNPGLALRNIGGLLSRSNALLIVTVPNAFSVRHIMSVGLWNTELVMPDHNYYFSYATLSSLLRESGLEVVKWYTYSDVDRISGRLRRTAKRWISQVMFRRMPFLAEGIIAISRASAVYLGGASGRSESASKWVQ